MVSKSRGLADSAAGRPILSRRSRTLGICSAPANSRSRIPRRAFRLGRRKPRYACSISLSGSRRSRRQRRHVPSRRSTLANCRRRGSRHNRAADGTHDNQGRTHEPARPRQFVPLGTESDKDPQCELDRPRIGLPRPLSSSCSRNCRCAWARRRTRLRSPSPPSPRPPGCGTGQERSSMGSSRSTGTGDRVRSAHRLVAGWGEIKTSRRSSGGDSCLSPG